MWHATVLIQGMRYKKTEICQTCSKLKNVCQTCLLDLEYGLPVQVRDQALQINDNLPRSSVNKEYFNHQVEAELAGTDGSIAYGELGQITGQNEMLGKLSRKAPYYKRNRPHVCSFWVKGECKRGEECPYRHEAPNDPEDPLSNQNIKDRFYGMNDPVADKLVKRYQETTKEEKMKAAGNLQINNEDDFESKKFSKTTPGLPGPLPIPTQEFKNDFFNLSSAAPLIAPLFNQNKSNKKFKGQAHTDTSSATISSGPTQSAPKTKKLDK